jgi:hypothetical protein
MCVILSYSHQGAHHKGQYIADEQRAASSPSITPPTSARPGNQYDAAEKNAEQNKRWWTDPNVYIAVFTFVLTAVAWSQMRISERQRVITESALALTQQANTIANKNADAAVKSGNAAEAAMDRADQRRKNYTVYVIAKQFEIVASGWAARTFQVGQTFADYHNATIIALNPYARYLEKNHKAVYDKIRDHWSTYRGGDEYGFITLGHYTCYAERKEKEYWITALFDIILTLNSE